MVLMVIDRKTIRLLILEDSQNEAERIISLFRNSGYATRAHRISSLDNLNEALKNTWGLMYSSIQQRKHRASSGAKKHSAHGPRYLIYSTH